MKNAHRLRLGSGLDRVQAPAGDVVSVTADNFVRIRAALTEPSARRPLEEPQPTGRLCGITNLLVEAQDIVG